MDTRVYLMVIPVCVLFLSCSSPTGPKHKGEGDFQIQSGDVTLAATLALPLGNGPHPAVVYVQGSSANPRSGSSGIRDWYSSQGLAFLHYDKRGIGESTGTFIRVNTANSIEMFDTLADDVLAAVAFLKQHESIDPNRIGLLGGSQGGWIAPLAASHNPEDITFLVIRVGPAVSVGLTRYYHDAVTGGLAGPPLTLTDEQIEMRLAEYDGIAGYEPLPVLRSLTAPALWMYGGKDRLVPSGASINVLQTLIDEQGKDFTIKLYPDVDHQFRHYQGTGQDAVRQYGDDILEWVDQRVGLSK